MCGQNLRIEIPLRPAPSLTGRRAPGQLRGIAPLTELLFDVTIAPSRCASPAALSTERCRRIVIRDPVPVVPAVQPFVPGTAKLVAVAVVARPSGAGLTVAVEVTGVPKRSPPKYPRLRSVHPDSRIQFTLPAVATALNVSVISLPVQFTGGANVAVAYCGLTAAA